MRLVSYLQDGRAIAGVIAADGAIVDVGRACSGSSMTMLDLIQAGPLLWARARETSASPSGTLGMSSAMLLAPIPWPRRNVFCVGWNYLEHFEEGRNVQSPEQQPDVARKIPAHPAIFTKNPATVTGPDSEVWFPSEHSQQLDWECELCVVIGLPGRDINEASAMSHVFGYTCANDISVRDVQRRHGGQWFKGKNFDTHLPLGPWIVTVDSLDPADLRIRTRVNGVVKQDSRTRHMAFKIPRLVSEISVGCALLPGDLIITGTPSGVGYARNPPEFMRPGDVVEVDIEGIGVLRNRVK